MKYNNMILKTFAIGFALSASVLACTVEAASEVKNVKVIANITPPPFELKKQEIRNLFMGGSSKYELYPVTLTVENDARTIFNTKVIGLTEARIQSYWVQMRFSGRLKEPTALASEEDIIEYLAQNKGAVAYVSSEMEIPDGLQVLYESD